MTAGSASPTEHAHDIQDYERQTTPSAFTLYSTSTLYDAWKMISTGPTNPVGS